MFDTLLALIQNSGRIVGKDELLRVTITATSLRSRKPAISSSPGAPFFEDVRDEVRFRALIDRTRLLGRARTAS